MPTVLTHDEIRAFSALYLGFFANSLPQYSSTFLETFQKINQKQCNEEQARNYMTEILQWVVLEVDEPALNTVKLQMADIDAGTIGRSINSIILKLQDPILLKEIQPWLEVCRSYFIEKEQAALHFISQTNTALFAGNRDATQQNTDLREFLRITNPLYLLLADIFLTKGIDEQQAEKQAHEFTVNLMSGDSGLISEERQRALFEAYGIDKNRYDQLLSKIQQCFQPEIEADVCINTQMAALAVDKEINASWEKIYQKMQQSVYYRTAILFSIKMLFGTKDSNDVIVNIVDGLIKSWDENSKIVDNDPNREILDGLFDSLKGEIKFVALLKQVAKLKNEQDILKLSVFLLNCLDINRDDKFRENILKNFRRYLNENKAQGGKYGACWQGSRVEPAQRDGKQEKTDPDSDSEDDETTVTREYYSLKHRKS